MKKEEEGERWKVEAERRERERKESYVHIEENRGCLKRPKREGERAWRSVWNGKKREKVENESNS